MYKNDIILLDTLEKNPLPKPLGYTFNTPDEFRNKVVNATCAEEIRILAEEYNIYNRYIDKTTWYVTMDTPTKTELANNTGGYLIVYKTNESSTKASSLSDEELVMELIKRGYTISKANK